MKFKLILSPILNPLSATAADYFPHGAMLTKTENKRDKVLWIGHEKDFVCQPFNKKMIKVVRIKNGLIIPGLYDLHFHWVQDQVCMMPKDSLLTWLKDFTWPSEAKFQDQEYSKKMAKTFFLKLKKVGTVGGAIFASPHAHSVDHALKFAEGQFIVGNPIMTANSPNYLTSSIKRSWKEIVNLSRKYDKNYAITPRFAPTVQPDFLIKLGKYSKQKKLFVQTHLSETKEEIKYVMSLYKKSKKFKKIKNYTEIYHHANLTGPNSIFAHAIYLSKNEYQLLANTGSSVAVCPTSNAPLSERGLGSGLCDVQKLTKYGVNWGLGSDIGAGPYLSMLDVMNSLYLQLNKKKKGSMTYLEALYRATLAPANILGKGHSHGNLLPGKEADYIILGMDTKKNLSAESLLKKILNSRPRDQLHQLVKSVYLAGKKII